MALKQSELRNPSSCLNKAAPNEPIFVLRAKDPLAPQTLRLWAAMSGLAHEQFKIEEALHLADQMEAWRSKEFPEAVAVPVPATSDKQAYVIDDNRPGGVRYR